MNVKCRVFEWTTTIVSENCLKLQMWGFKLQMWGVEFLSEWVWRSWVNVRCRIFELMKGRSNKKSRKCPKAYLRPIHRHHRARGLSRECCCARRASMKGGSVVSLAIMQISLQFTCYVRVNFPKQWSQ
jgi:hypothetical protein